MMITQRLSLGLIALYLCATVLTGQEVDFADANLKAVVEAKLGILDPTPTDMLVLHSLDAHGKDIKSLKGLEFAMNLRTLLLYDNKVSDISPLSDLTSLSHLDLDDNQIKSIGALSDLVSLRTLDLDDNKISSINALSNLTNLSSLYLEDNQLSSISALSNLNLRRLSLEDNQVRNISPLAGLTKLSHLYAENNGISEISALAGLDELRYLDLHENAISDLSPLSGLHKLEYLDLSINWIMDISALSELTNMHTLNVFLNSITDVRPLSRLTGLQKLHLHYNQITDISALMNLTDLQALELHKNRLDQAAYCTYLPTLVSQNPNMDLSYSPSTAGVERVWASTGLHPDKIDIGWDELCNGPDLSSYYRVFRGSSPEGAKKAISPWQSEIGFTDRAVDAGSQYSYWIQSSTDSQGDGAVGFVGPAMGWLRHKYSLTLSSNAGGSVLLPGAGTHLHPTEEFVAIEALPIDVRLYAFSHWAGTAVDAGRVDDPSQASSVVLVDDVYSVQAHFVTSLETLYVDDNGPGDPGPGESALSDPIENGSADHPFDRIQEAIDVAVDGVTVIVHPGVYYETIDLLGKHIELIGADPNGLGLPIIDGDGVGPVVSFYRGEDQHCRLTGFVITRGMGDLAGAIYCQGSSPTLSNCLIVGNRATDPNGAALYCRDSQAVFTNCTMADNIGGEQSAGMRLLDSDIVLTNSIVWGNAPRDILIAGASDPMISYSNIADVSGLGNMSIDPVFAQSGDWFNPSDPSLAPGPGVALAVWTAGDYHLQSASGRWHVGRQVWIKDELSSSCIDSGHPMSPVGSELVPHGDRINLGVYGGTIEGSKSHE